MKTLDKTLDVAQHLRSFLRVLGQVGCNYLQFTANRPKLKGYPHVTKGRAEKKKDGHTEVSGKRPTISKRYSSYSH